ncbi:MFS transporter [Sphingosinicella microcystinivorans]|uniref:MFS family arabinose efflux permease n=1 Tax=Sphingosinicella microcystinivorans TaxID=335406 RepID=A0AAD1D8G3_SPHMI|nr:MFS transporter [Sphingosinicella microcystinivorans]RKS86310.1 putative MFS family arabinose efflux permease [Sphingosinicella microcystinivorans]BBE35645.1 MFS transporter [Sphingosinicella microcystinivorans]
MSRMPAGGIDELLGGWRLLIACAVGVGCSAIALPYYAIGALTRPIEDAMGWARSDIQFAILFSSGVGALSAPVTGWMIEKFGTRAVALPSFFGVSAGLFVAASANTISMFYAGFALAAILGAGTNPVLWSRAIAGSFDKARGTALGLALVGTAFAALALPSMVTALVEASGWRHALRGVALLPLVLALPLVFLWLRSGSDGVSGSDAVAHVGVKVGEAVSHYRFWLLGLSILAGYLAISGLLTGLIPALTDRGLSAASASAIVGMIGIAMIPGRIAVGIVIDRIWAPAVACVLLLLSAIACLVLQQTTDTALLLAACAVLGLTAGAELDLLAFLTARYFGLTQFSKIYALLYAALATGSAVAPGMFAFLREKTGSYDLSFSVAAALFVVAALLLPMLGRYPNFTPENQSAQPESA